jgi:MarR family transcriptional regulator, organic hydroperoxide resistance regulator
VSKARFLDTHLAYQLSHAAHVVSRELTQTLHDKNISVAEWRVLASLYDDAPTTVLRLAERTLYQQTTLTKLLDRMQAAGLIQRGASALDRRERLLTLTAAGKKLAASLTRRASHAEKKACALLSQAERAALEKALSVLTHPA